MLDSALRGLLRQPASCATRRGYAVPCIDCWPECRRASLRYSSRISQGTTDQANLPGTIDEHPNWRRRLECDLEELALRPQFLSIAQAMAEERPRRS